MLGAAIAKFAGGTHGLEQAALGFDVADLGDVFEDDFVRGEDGGGHAGERGVFCAGNFDGAEEGIASADDELVHGSECTKQGCGSGGVLWGVRVPRWMRGEGNSTRLHPRRDEGGRASDVHLCVLVSARLEFSLECYGLDQPTKTK